MMLNAGIITCDELRELLEYDRVLAGHLEKLGVRCEPVVWDNPSADWKKYDFLLMRTAWGYYRQYERFLQFMHFLKEEDIRIFNTADIIINNSHKFYLKELKANGVNIIPTHFIKKKTVMSVMKLVSIGKWDRYILKPAVSAGSFNTHLFDAADPKGEDTFQAMVRDNDLLIQKYLPEIADGELSTIFFAGEFSYTVRKRPAAGDFRVQRDYGGVYERVEPPTEVLYECDKVMELLDPDFLYARIDGVFTRGQFRVMEVEMIEPDLYMDVVPEAIPHLAELIASRVGNM